MKRLFWRIVYPFAVLANKLGASYKWVNVGKGAWIEPGKGFNLLWHHKWYGYELRLIPDKVNLCGIMYLVSVFDGHVMFRSENTIFKYKIEFSCMESGGTWDVSIDRSTSLCHVIEAANWVKAAYGESFNIDRKRIEIK